MILDLHATRVCSVAPLVRDAALGRSDWREAAAAIAGGIGVSKIGVERLSPLIGSPGVAAVHALHASRSFVRRWRTAFGGAHAVIESGDQSHVAAYDVVALEQGGEIAERLGDKLRSAGCLCLGIDSELGFYALRVEAQAAGAAHVDMRCLLDCAHELSRAAVTADDMRSAKQELVLKLLDSGHTAAFVIDSRGWVKSENASARALIGEILHFPNNAAQTPPAEGAPLDVAGYFQLEKARTSQHMAVTPGGRRLIVYAAPWGQEKSIFVSGDELLIVWDTRIDAPLFSLSGERNTQTLREALRQTFGLTRMESMLASQLVGCDLRTAAQDCGMAYETARSHLKSMFGRMKIRSQGELVALVARFAYHDRLRRMLATP